MSFPRYPRYKQSGVEWLGEVPGHWEVRRLKHACRVFPSNVDKKSYEGESPVLLCNYTDVYYNERIIAGMDLMRATATPEQIAKFTLRAGDTIVTKDSETADDIAIAAYVPEDLPGVVCGYHLSMVRPSQGINGAFVKRIFDSVYAKSCFAVRANGLTRVGLGQYEIDNVELPFPPLAEQDQIVTFLDRETAKIDALIAEQQRLMDVLKEKRQAVISHAVTRGLNPMARMKDSGIEWLGEVPAHWDVTKIGHLCSKIEQGWSPQCDGVPAESEQEWGVLKVGCVNGGRFNPAENKRLPEELEPIPSLGIKKYDLLVSRANTRELVGSAAVAERDYPKLMLCDKLYRLLFDSRTCPQFVSYFLGSGPIREQIALGATGASDSMLNIAQSTILDLRLALPPSDEQTAIVAFLNDDLAKLDDLLAKTQHAIDLLQERRTALISAAVTGQIDVRGFAS